MGAQHSQCNYSRKCSRIPFCQLCFIFTCTICLVNISGITTVTIVGDAERNETALQDVTLSVTICTGSSFTFTVQWYYNNQPIINDGNYTITNTSLSSSLTILTTVPSDTGTYRVDVNSSVSNNSATINLNIEGT